MMNLMSQGHRSLPTFMASPWALIFLCAALLYFATSAATLAQTADTNPQRFPIYEYQVKGNSVLTDLAIQRAVSGFTGE